MTNKAPKILFEKEEEELDFFGETLVKGKEYITLLTNDGGSFVVPCDLLRKNSQTFAQMLGSDF